MSRDAAEVARVSADAMWKDDAASRSLGMTLDKIAPGHAVLSMKIGVNMVNGLGSCHGGFIFMLADSAFGYACNSRGQRHMAQNCQITYLAPARLGARLTAEARERYRARQEFTPIHANPSSIDKHELIQVEQQSARIGESKLLHMSGQCQLLRI